MLSWNSSGRMSKGLVSFVRFQTERGHAVVFCFHFLQDCLFWGIEERGECLHWSDTGPQHYNDVIMGAMASQITSMFTQPFIQGRRSKKTSKLRVTGLCVGIRRWPVNSPHKWPVTRKMFPFDDVIMETFTPFAVQIIIENNREWRK